MPVDDAFPNRLNRLRSPVWKKHVILLCDVSLWKLPSVERLRNIIMIQERHPMNLLPCMKGQIGAIRDFLTIFWQDQHLRFILNHIWIAIFTSSVTCFVALLDCYGPTEAGERKSHGDLDPCGAPHGQRQRPTKATGESGDETYWHSLHLGAKGEKG